MAALNIPRAAEITAPGLEIKRLRQAVPSDGGESTISVALTTLSNKRLEGIPIAQEIAPKKFCFFDSEGNEITKEEAWKLADGVAYYQSKTDPSKGRLRHRGTFIKEDDARTHVSHSRARSKASCSSDIANLCDLENFDVLQSVSEEEPAFEKVRDDGIKETRRSGLEWWRVFAVLVFMVALSMRIYLNFEVKVGNPIRHLSPELSRLLAEGEAFGTNPIQHLSPELSGLLASDETFGSKEDGMRLRLLGWTRQKTDDELSKEKLREMASAEVDRILASHKVGEILGNGSLKEQRQAFHRILRLLHPDKGLTSPSCPRASLALRLALAAREA